jgi:hypothetical protein
VTGYTRTDRDDRDRDDRDKFFTQKFLQTQRHVIRIRAYRTYTIITTTSLKCEFKVFYCEARVKKI